MIEFKRVWKKFRDQVVIRDLSLRIETGENFFILGRTGAWKTVLTRMLVGLIRPDSGEILLDGERVDHLDKGHLREVRKKCGMIFQAPILFDSLSAFENIAFGLRRHFNLTEPELEKRVMELLRLVHLDPEVCGQFPSQLSFGMQKRVSLARAIVLSPKTLIYDEPTTGLDPFTARQINFLIQELKQKLGVTSIVVSHDLESMRQVADRVGLLESGNFVIVAKPAELALSQDPFVKRFLEAC